MPENTTSNPVADLLRQKLSIIESILGVFETPKQDTARRSEVRKEVREELASSLSEFPSEVLDAVQNFRETVFPIVAADPATAVFLSEVLSDTRDAVSSLANGSIERMVRERIGEEVQEVGELPDYNALAEQLETLKQEANDLFGACLVMGLDPATDLPEGSWKITPKGKTALDLPRKIDDRTLANLNGEPTDNGDGVIVTRPVFAIDGEELPIGVTLRELPAHLSFTKNGNLRKNTVTFEDVTTAIDLRKKEGSVKLNGQTVSWRRARVA